MACAAKFTLDFDHFIRYGKVISCGDHFSEFTSEHECYDDPIHYCRDSSQQPVSFPFEYELLSLVLPVDVQLEC